jgi:hypothetical protein
LRIQLRDAVERRDWRDIIALGAVQGLAAARDESAVDDILALARDRSRYWSARVTSLQALAEIGANRPHLAPRLVDELVPFLDDPRVLVHQRCTGALVALGHPGALEALQRKGVTAARPEMRVVCLAAADDLSARLKKGEEVDRLRETVEKLREETKALKDQVAEISVKVGPQGGRPGGNSSLRAAARNPVRRAVKKASRKAAGRSAPAAVPKRRPKPGGTTPRIPKRSARSVVKKAAQKTKRR